MLTIAMQKEQVRTRKTLTKKQPTGEVKYVAGVQLCAQIRVKGRDQSADAGEA